MQRNKDREGQREKSKTDRDPPSLSRYHRSAVCSCPSLCQQTPVLLIWGWGQGWDTGAVTLHAHHFDSQCSVSFDEGPSGLVQLSPSPLPVFSVLNFLSPVRYFLSERLMIPMKLP